jgi:hypothetical protein
VTSIDLADVLTNDMAFPAGAPRDKLLDTLFTALVSPDPVVRDDTAYPIFATWIGRGEFDESLEAIGDQVATLLGHPEIQARTFATLVLGWVIRRDTVAGVVPSEAARRWRSAFDGWWSAETDIRGYDDDLGWLHAIAHGADTVRAFALSPHSTNADLTSLLSLCARRVLTPTDYLFAHAEEDRVAYAMAAALSRVPSGDDATRWLTPVAQTIEAGEPGPVPPFASNTLRTLNSLYVATHRGVVAYNPVTQERSEPLTAPAQTEVLARLAEILRMPSYWLA